MAFDTAGYHTYLNQALAEQDDENIFFGGMGNSQALRLAGMVALFPHPFASVRDAPAGNLLLRSGLGLWSAYALEINPTVGYLALTPVVDNNYSDADAAFYRAAAAEDVDALAAYAARWPQDRNIEEAAALLFELGLAAGASVEQLLQAVRLGLAVRAEQRRMEYVASFAVPLYQGERQG